MNLKNPHKIIRKRWTYNYFLQTQGIFSRIAISRLIIKITDWMKWQKILDWARTWISYCIGRLLILNGLRKLAYWMALSSGNPLLWKLIRQSTTGHSSTGACLKIFENQTRFCKIMERQDIVRKLFNHNRYISPIETFRGLFVDWFVSAIQRFFHLCEDYRRLDLQLVGYSLSVLVVTLLQMSANFQTKISARPRVLL